MKGNEIQDAAPTSGNSPPNGEGFVTPKANETEVAERVGFEPCQPL